MLTHESRQLPSWLIFDVRQKKMLPLVHFLLFAAFFASALHTFLLFDQILRKEYGEHLGSWEQDGKPIGFFWIPKGGEIVGGSIARSGLFFKWAFALPDWAESRADLIPLFSKLRRSLVIGTCIWIIAVITLFTSTL